MSNKHLGFIVRFSLALSVVTLIAHAEPEPAYVPSPGAGLIEVRRPADITGSDVDSVWQREIRTHAVLMRQRSLFAGALSKETSEVRKTTIFKDLSDRPRMIEWMEMNVRVQVVPGTALIEISVPPMEGADDARIIVREVVEAYLGNVAERSFLKAQSKNQALTTLQQRYRDESHEITDRVAQLLAKTPDVEAKAAWAEQLDSAKRAQARILTKLDRIQDELELLQVEQSQKLSGDVAWAVMPEPPPTKKPHTP